MAWFGADPGGDKAFGVALLHTDASFETSVVSCADDAMGWLLGKAATILAVGIDAPLWWSSGKSGDREVDQYLRKRFNISGGTVQAANSLRGAVLIQGVLLATLLRGRFPQLPITESHPKALLKALKLATKDRNAPWKTIAESFSLAGGEPQSEHERDALLGAVASREGSTGAWTCDLALRGRPRCEQDPATVPWGPVSYWWPDH
jgi:predicted nuclease with RNAse H fold